MNTVWAISTVVIKELYRRKDFYVLLVLTTLLTLAAGSMSFFNDNTIVRALKEICLLLIWISSLIIGITTAARQIPSEKENRTIFPLLAKPVTRWQVVLGKFLGCWLACGIALIVFYVFFGILVGAREHTLPVASFAKLMWMQWMALGVVVALALLGSVVLSAPGPNATLCFIVVLGVTFVGPHLGKVSVGLTEPASTLLYSIYFLIPHLEWYDLRDIFINDQALPGNVACFMATFYAAAYATLLLVLTWARFRRQNLNT